MVTGISYFVQHDITCLLYCLVDVLQLASLIA